MESLRLLPRALFFVVFMALPFFYVNAEVVFLKSGRVLIGEIQGPTPGGVSYSVFGETVEVSIESIQKTERTLESLSALIVELTLKDGSVIRGKIVDFDSDIGLFLDISFGTLTIPIQAIASVDDPALNRRFAPATFQLRAGGGMQFPLLGTEKNFSPSWYSSAGFDWSVPGLRGWQVGLQAEAFGLSFMHSSTSNYQLYSLVPRLSFQFLDLKALEGLLSQFTPFVAFGVGPAYISVVDTAASVAKAESLTLEGSLSTGIQFNVFRELAVKLEGFAAVVWQTKLPYSAAGLSLSAGWEQ